jgi:RNA polymerase sigma-70 factor (ECF subfamily)
VPDPGLICRPPCITLGSVKAAAMEYREFDYDLFVRPLEPRMMRSIWRIVRDREAAEDALQDALALIWRKRDVVARHPRPEALIIRIAVSTALDALRKSRRRLRHEIPSLPVERVDDTAPLAGKEIEDRDLRTAIIGAIGQLPKRQAAAVLLHVVEEQSYEDIARAMGCSESTVRVNVMRGRERLARCLARKRPDLVGGRGQKRKEDVS